MYTHQSSGSFTSAAKAAAVGVLTALACSLEVSGLYAMNIKATATAMTLKVWSIFFLGITVTETSDLKNAENFGYLPGSGLHPLQPLKLVAARWRAGVHDCKAL